MEAVRTKLKREVFSKKARDCKSHKQHLNAKRQERVLAGKALKFGGWVSEESCVNNRTQVQEGYDE